MFQLTHPIKLERRGPELWRMHANAMHVGVMLRDACMCGAKCIGACIHYIVYVSMHVAHAPLIFILFYFKC